MFRYSPASSAPPSQAFPTASLLGEDRATSMAQRGGDDELADRLGGISLESVSAGEGKSPIGPAGLIHKVRNVTPSVSARLLRDASISPSGAS